VYHWPIKLLESGEKIGDPEGMELRRAVVKRRFREFLNFQLRMESNAKLRNLLKGVKGPSKWVNSPFGKNEESTVTARRQLLESFLQELCSKPGIFDSAEVLEFLGYGCEVAVEYVKKPGAFVGGVNRLDKMLARTVSGMFQTLRTALPNFDHQDSSGSCPSDKSSSVSSSFVPDHHHSSSATIDGEHCAPKGILQNFQNRILTNNNNSNNVIPEVPFHSNYNFECSAREGVDRVESHVEHFIDRETEDSSENDRKHRESFSCKVKRRNVTAAGRLVVDLPVLATPPTDLDLYGRLGTCKFYLLADRSNRS
jgi:hypothetical protein